MRLEAFEIVGVGPIDVVRTSNLSDVVVLAGPNGVGKTTINNALLDIARNPRPMKQTAIVVGATTEKERSQWGKDKLDTSNAADCGKLRATLQRNQRRNKYESSVLNFDSDRAIRNVQGFNPAWDIINPFLDDVGWDLGFSSLSNRYNDVRHSLFRLVESQKREVADRAFALRGAGSESMPLDFPDVLKPFKDAFWQLVAPKVLSEVSVRDQQIYYTYESRRLTFETLSSGEREVVNIVFDFLLRGPAHCIIIFDEPELHLHPELAYKLLQTLSRIGTRNQFIFSSHSPEIIGASLENTVVFVTPRNADHENQAVVVQREDATHHALQALGHSIGIISLGKKLILIEGEESSLDKLTYGAILKNRFPEFVLVPVGGKDTLRSFEDVRNSILNKTIWGVEFFLLCDRDAVNAFGRKVIEADPTSRMRQLPRYHLENYFLDETVLAEAFAAVEPEGSWLRDPIQIKERLLQIARRTVPYAVALNVNATVRESVGNVSIMPKGVGEATSPDELFTLIKARLESERVRVSTGLDQKGIEIVIQSEFTRLLEAVEKDSPDWKRDLPGRQIFNRFSSVAQMHTGRLKHLYLRASETRDTFSDVVSIFESFRGTKSS